jgi:hypothetical protein
VTPIVDPSRHGSVHWARIETKNQPLLETNWGKMAVQSA